MRLFSLAFVCVGMMEHSGRFSRSRYRLKGEDISSARILRPQYFVQGFRITICVRYERILVDAPCSSDRHLALAPQQLAQWSQTHVAQAAALQVNCACLLVSCCCSKLDLRAQCLRPGLIYICVAGEAVGFCHPLRSYGSACDVSFEL